MGAAGFLGFYVVLRFLFIVLIQDVYGPTPLDEIFTVLMLPFASMCVGRYWQRCKTLLLFFLLYTAVLIVSALIEPFAGVPQPLAALYDIALDSKMLIVYFGFYYLFRADRDPSRTLRRICWVLAGVALINAPFVFRDFLIGGGVGLRGQPLLPRMGFYQPQGLLIHHLESCWLSYVGALSAVYLYLDRKKKVTAVCAALLVATMFIHLSTKESVAFLFCLSLLFINKGGAIKVGMSVLASVVVIGVMWVVTPLGDLVLGQFDNYLGDTSDSMVRTVLSIQSFNIAADRFPLGSGGGTYASPPSFQLGYSEVYVKYGVSDLWGATPDNPNFLVDVFWPKIIAQAGVIGLLLYFCFLWVFSRSTIAHYQLRSGYQGWLCLSIILSAFFISLASTPYTHELLFVVVGLFASYSAVALSRAKISVR